MAQREREGERESSEATVPWREIFMHAGVTEILHAIAYAEKERENKGEFGWARGKRKRNHVRAK